MKLTSRLVSFSPRRESKPLDHFLAYFVSNAPVDLLAVAKARDTFSFRCACVSVEPAADLDELLPASSLLALDAVFLPVGMPALPLAEAAALRR